MSDEQEHKHNEHSQVPKPTNASAATTAPAAEAFAPNLLAAAAPALLGDSRLSGQGNGATRTAVLQRAQQTIGNRATRAVLQRQVATPLPVQREGDIPIVKNPTVKTMAEFIALVRKIEMDNPGLSALQIAQKIRLNKYNTTSWEKLLPSGAGKPPVGVSSHVSQNDVTTLNGEFVITLPDGGQSDPSHIVAGIEAKMEKQSPGWPITDVVPAQLSQSDIATWAGDVGSAAGEWMTAHPLPNYPNPTKQDYMTELSPVSDMVGDIDGVALSSGTAANGFAFDPTKPLSSNLERFYFPAAAAPQQGARKRFHTFCAVEHLALAADGVTLSDSAIRYISNRVHAFADFYTKNDPNILMWMVMNSNPGLLETIFTETVAEKWIARANDWKWFVDQFVAYVQNGLRAEGR